MGSSLRSRGMQMEEEKPEEDGNVRHEKQGYRYQHWRSADSEQRPLKGTCSCSTFKRADWRRLRMPFSDYFLRLRTRNELVLGCEASFVLLLLQLLLLWGAIRDQRSIPC